MTLYIITLLFLCNLVVSLNPAPNAQGTASSSISQPCQGIDSQNPCEPVSNWSTGNVNEEDDRICSSDADCPINYHCHSGECIRSPRDGLKKVVRGNRQAGKCSTSVDCPPGYYCWRGGCVQIPRSAAKPDNDQDSHPAHTQQCKHVTDCPQGKWCMEGFCWPFDQPSQLAIREADIGETANAPRTQQRCHLHAHCGPTGLCIHGWCQYPFNVMSRDNTESVGVGDEATEEGDILGPRKCTSDRECYPRALCVNGRCNHSHGDDDS
ncbi:hypothetical protein F9C07_2278757 [Aspergillus flavus]|uniref:Dickkopf N-terminal cysteine-rich domain-containing protein n=1 Tax=Aspergillus flavus (strain ATCC 200026 / FGSC A1120 / IAM 13836 / NRRL 3357 / JCM 12722 / SRRC 167) TaxID=332952 RepID=A0A7U2MP82_ASPFN|nr:hypothetical protein F9C07_2278757 [Aspergillus flavus]